ncbi:S-adenosyl-L-methionine-dependent methyltransferase [Jimgerdemannia flammicorona]|uniref:S-adenosyl-L-methionine-dependent methyltransferase n=1 Tax=Jimgerdemannia flammicorona TaxID=994334 RepID=A0A433QB30_9FUNG|nr:S-adenosyl-L-methionine-dependent methyltransferase [Jimgerdemannia flammicorona]
MGNFVFDPFNEQPDAEDRVTRIFQAARFLRYESGPPPVDPSLPPGFKWIGDRGFKPEGNPAYPNPCDATEVLRLNNQHKQIRIVLQGNQMAPVHEQLKNGARVLDAGCGTGIWTIDMAHTYPASDFTATDMIDIFAHGMENLASAPPNCHFQIADTTKRLPFPDEAFDYVFQRLAFSSFRENQWPKVISELIRVTKQGGWLELVDANAMIENAGPSGLDFCLRIKQFLTLRDINTDYALTLGEVLKSAALQDVVFDHREIPIGWGPEEIAIPTAKTFENTLRCLKPQATIALGLGDKEFDEMVEEVLMEIVSQKCYWNVFYAYGRKP